MRYWRKEMKQDIINLKSDQLDRRYMNELIRINYYAHVINAIDDKVDFDINEDLPSSIRFGDQQIFVELMRNICEDVLESYGMLGKVEEFYDQLSLPEVDTRTVYENVNNYVMPYADLDAFDVYVMDCLKEDARE